MKRRVILPCFNTYVIEQANRPVWDNIRDCLGRCCGDIKFGAWHPQTINEHMMAYIFHQFSSKLSRNTKWYIRNDKDKFHDYPAYIAMERYEKFAIVLYEDSIYITFRRYRYDVLKGKTDIMVDILNRMGINDELIEAMYGMPQYSDGKRYSGFYKIIGINSKVYQYMFITALLECIFDRISDKDEEEPEQIKIMLPQPYIHYHILDECVMLVNKYRESMLIQDINEFKHTDERLDRFLKKEEECINVESPEGILKELKIILENVEGEKEALERGFKNPDKSPQTLRTEEKDKEYLYQRIDSKFDKCEAEIIKLFMSHLSKIGKFHYRHCVQSVGPLLETAVKLAMPDAFRYTIYALEYNYLLRRESKLELFSQLFIKFTNYLSYDSSDVVWRYVIAKLTEKPALMKIAMLDPEFVRLLKSRNKYQGQMFDLNRFKSKTYKSVIYTDFEKLKKEREDLRLIQAQRQWNSRKPTLSRSESVFKAFSDVELYYPNDEETTWNIKNLFRENFSLDEDDPDYKFLNMNMKDLMSGNF